MIYELRGIYVLGLRSILVYLPKHINVVFSIGYLGVLWMKTKKENLAEQKRREKANLRIIEGQKLEGKTLIKDQRFRLGEYYDE